MESNELRIKERRNIRTQTESSNQNLQIKPRNNQRRIPLTEELKIAMQELKWERLSIEREYERIRKFSLLECIRKRVSDLLDDLPDMVYELVTQKEIDGLIKRNFLRERKVRFAKENDFEGEPKKHQSDAENEKDNAIDEIKVILQILGNDTSNKLMIENFALLEKRITCVEQRLSGMLRKFPEFKDKCHSEMKIDVELIKSDLQNFVDMFNKVFSSPYELDTEIIKMGATDSISATNRLKFQLLSRLAGPNNMLKFSPTSGNAIDLNDHNEAERTSGSSTLKSRNGKDGTKRRVNKKESKPDVHSVKAVDSLIALRERFKSQSVKWRQMQTPRYREEHQEKGNEFDLSKARKFPKKIKLSPAKIPLPPPTTKVEESPKETLAVEEIKAVTQPEQINKSKNNANTLIESVENSQNISENVSRDLQEIADAFKKMFMSRDSNKNKAKSSTTPTKKREAVKVQPKAQNGKSKNSSLPHNAKDKTQNTSTPNDVTRLEKKAHPSKTKRTAKKTNFIALKYEELTNKIIKNDLENAQQSEEEVNDVKKAPVSSKSNYKKIFLFKIKPKSSTKQRNQSPTQKSTKAITAPSKGSTKFPIKSTRVTKNLPKPPGNEKEPSSNMNSKLNEIQKPGLKFTISSESLIEPTMRLPPSNWVYTINENVGGTEENYAG